MHSQLSSIAQDLRRFFADSLDPLAPPCARKDEGFNRLALRLFRLQHELNLPYRRLCDARGLRPESVADWRQFPAVSTSAFKEFAFSCLKESERTTHFESSGTTQTARSRSHHSRESLQLYHASLLPWFQRHILPDARNSPAGDNTLQTFISLTPSPSEAPHSSLVHMLDAVSRKAWFAQARFVGERNPDGAWTLDLGTLFAVIKEACFENQPVTLTGTAFNYVHWLDAMASESLRLPEGSRIMETGGYKGRSRELSRDELHAELSLGLGVAPDHIVTEYGMTELGSQAYDQIVNRNSGPRTLKFPPWTRATVVSCETGLEVAEGESGLVRIFDLANLYSVVAVETEDLAIRHQDGIELLGRRSTAQPRGCSLLAV